jgi:hypothetical protein
VAIPAAELSRDVLYRNGSGKDARARGAVGADVGADRRLDRLALGRAGVPGHERPKELVVDLEGSPHDLEYAINMAYSQTAASRS